MLILNLDNRIVEGQKFSLTLDEAFFKMAGGIITRGNVSADCVCDKIANDCFHFKIHSVGKVFTLCDRCLEDVELRINITNDMLFQLGDEDFDDGDMLIVDRNNPIVNMDNLVYQLVVVSLPIKRIHEPGMCNDVMMKEIMIHQVARSNDEQIDNSQQPSDDTTYYDHRWDNLKSLLNK